MRLIIISRCNPTKKRPIFGFSLFVESPWNCLPRGYREAIIGPVNFMVFFVEKCILTGLTFTEIASTEKNNDHLKKTREAARAR